ncbi:MAG: inner-rane translocator [Frankiales bacterium]|nr:inner-rane translocator [Frankiales bacterium]
MSLLVDVGTGAVRGGTAIMFAALGETLAERAGVINLGTEGCMLGGALSGYAVGSVTGNVWVGLAAGVAAGALLGLIHALLVVFRGANQLATGLTLLFFALGVTSLFGSAFVGKTAPTLTAMAVPGLSHLPVLGPILFHHDLLTYLSYAAAPAMWVFLRRSRTGLRVRAAGEAADVLRVHGVSVAWVRCLAVVAGGALAGLGGAQLSLVYSNSWFENMTQGRGFIAVALVIFAAWNPLRVMAGSYLFGAALALSPALQARGYGLNQFALDAIPFVLTLLVLAVFGRRTLLAAPAELKRVFEGSRS